MTYIDISYPIDNSMVIYPGNPSFHVERVLDIENGDSANVSLISIGSHMGTHIDAPAHTILGGATIDQIPLERMNGKARVVDATGRNEIDEDFLRQIPINTDDIILFKTDNSLHWSCNRILEDYVTLTYDAAEYLANKMIKMVGIDYLTIERPRRKRVREKSIHTTLLSKCVLICEAIRMERASAGEYEIVCLPLPITNIDGCPVRIILKNG